MLDNHLHANAINADRLRHTASKWNGSRYVRPTSRKAIG